MELLLWRWSTAVQISSAVMIAIFFVALARNDSRVALRWWRLAWLINVGALTVTLVYWYVQPPDAWRPLVRGLYLAGKTTFLLLVLQGARALLRPGSPLFTRHQLLSIAAVAIALGMFVLVSVDYVGVGQALMIAVVLGAGSVWLARSGESFVTWLAAGLAVRGILGLAEALAYGSRLWPIADPDRAESISAFLAVHSSLDTGAEWFIALGCVLAVTGRSQYELRLTNERLLEAQVNLRRLVDHDALTGLANRRTLQAVLRGVQPRGAMLLFFDIDAFKAINDLHGHHIGDECLKRFADALRESFRPDDHVIRYAGDEFLIVASGLDRTAVDERVEQMRWRLRKASGHLPHFTFSVGVGELPPGGNPEAVLQLADEAMYQRKGVSRQRASA